MATAQFRLGLHTFYLIEHSPDQGWQVHLQRDGLASTKASGLSRAAAFRASERLNRAGLVSLIVGGQP